MADGRLTFYVIYEKPKDHPEGYVLRRQHAMGDGTVTFDKVGYYFDSVEECHKMLPPGLTKIGPWPGDDPVIMEVWV